MRFEISKFDELLGGVEGGRVVLIESVGDLGLRIALGFLKNAVAEGRRVFAVVSKRLREDVGKCLGNVRVLVPDEEFTLHELFTVSLAMKRVEENVGLVDILQPLLIIHSPEKVYQLFQDICEMVRERKGILLATIDKKLVDGKVLAMFESEADYVIEIEEVVEGLRIRRGIRVKRNPKKPPTKFYELLVDENGMRLGERID